MPLVVSAALALFASLRLRGGYRWWALAAVPVVTVALITYVPTGPFNRMGDSDTGLRNDVVLAAFFVFIYYPLLIRWGINTLLRTPRVAPPDGDPGPASERDAVSTAAAPAARPKV